MDSQEPTSSTRSSTNSLYGYGRALAVSVEGNIGSGKSTFLEYCAKHPSVTVFPEPVEKWENLNGVNLLQNMYTDPLKWALPFQIYAGATVLQNYQAAVSTRIRLVERSLLSARNVFVKHMKQHGTMDPLTDSILDTWFDAALYEHSASPHAVIYLRTTPAVAYTRLRRRSRSAESATSLGYLTELHDLHETWISSLLSLNTDPNNPTFHVFIIDADRSVEEMYAEFDSCIQDLECLAI